MCDGFTNLVSSQIRGRPVLHIYYSTGTCMAWYYFAGAIALTGAAFGEARIPFLLSSINCSGSETNLLNCTVAQEVDACETPFEDAGVICQGYRWWLLVAQCVVYEFCKQLLLLFLQAYAGYINISVLIVTLLFAILQIPLPLKETVLMVKLEWPMEQHRLEG